MSRLALPDLQTRKGAGPPIVMVTAYDRPGAHWADAAGVDLLLVGDSAATVVLGHASPRAMRLDDSALLTEAVARGSTRALVVGDLPAGSYERTDAQAVASAHRLVAAGAHLVKLEGALLERIAAIVASGVPVMAHLGLLPQQADGDHRARARDADSALALLRDGEAVQRAGASMLVLEAIPPEVAAAVTARLRIPTIGIGAGAACDGQVIVLHDLLGLTPPPHPRFVEPYAALGEAIRDAVARWAADVQARRYPAARHTYAMPDPERERFAAALRAAPPST